MKTEVIIIGAGGHGQVVADILLQMQKAGDHLRPLGYMDDDPELHNREFLSLPVFGPKNARTTIRHDAIIIAIGDNQIRKTIFNQFEKSGEKYIIAKHPRAIIASNVSIGWGSMIVAGVIVNTGSNIAQNVILNTGCTIDHHCSIASHVHIGPGAHIGGNVTIFEGVLVGIGASIVPGICINAGATIGAGSVVISDVPAGSTVVGVPAKLLE